MNRTHTAPRYALAALVGVVLAVLPLAPAAGAPMVTCAERSIPTTATTWPRRPTRWSYR